MMLSSCVMKVLVLVMKVMKGAYIRTPALLFLLPPPLPILAPLLLHHYYYYRGGLKPEGPYNGRSLSGMGLTRERWCCASGRLSLQARLEHMSDEYKNRCIIIIVFAVAHTLGTNGTRYHNSGSPTVTELNKRG